MRTSLDKTDAPPRPERRQEQNRKGAPAPAFEAMRRERAASPDSMANLVLPASRTPLNARSKARRRGWIMRRTLFLADVTGILLAGLTTTLLIGNSGDTDYISGASELLLVLLAVPMWGFAAHVAGLYGFDEDRANHSTADDLVRVFMLVTAGAWMLTQGAELTQTASPDPVKATVLWGLSISLIVVLRATVRRAARRTRAYHQRTVVLGGGRVGQLLARKLMLHTEYGLDLVGLVDDDPMPRPTFLDDIPVLGGLHDLPLIVEEQDVERVIIAYSREMNDEMLALIRRLRDGGVQVDVVPRYFEVVGPKVDIHTVGGISLMGLPPVRLSRTSALMKRGLDLVVSALALIVLSPLFLLVSLLVKLDSPGPVFFRQRRLGKDMKEFTLLKFRSMRAGDNSAEHAAYIATSMTDPELQGAGQFKLQREDRVTRVGAFLRKTSLDELPQLINVLRGDMSLVGPRPCLAYEVEHFKTHHFERFLVPAGLTGLWQVSARAQSTFAEALDLDVLYAQSASLGLDLQLILRTPLQLLRSRATS